MTVQTHASRTHAIRDIAVQFGTRIANLALGIVVTAVIVRGLGASRFGEWLTLLTVIQLAGYFTTFGLEAVTVREAAARPERAEQTVSALIAVRLLLAIPSVVVGLVVVLLVHEGSVMLAAGLLLLLQIPIGVGSSFQVVHQLRVDNRIPMAVLTINSVVWAIAVAVIAAAGGGLVPLAIAMTASTALTASLQTAASLRVMPLRRPSRGEMRRLLRIGAPLGIAGLLVIAYAKIDQVIVFEQVGAEGAGQYGAAYRLLEQAHFLPMSVMTTLAPVIAALWASDPRRVLRITGQGVELMTIGSLGGLVFTLVAAVPIMRFFFGEGLTTGASVLPILCGSFVVVCIGYALNSLMLVLDLVRKQVIIATVGLVVNVVGNLLLVPRYGIEAAAWMTLVTEAAVVAVGTAYVLRALGDLRPSAGRLPNILVAALWLLAVLLVAKVAGADGLAPLLLVAVVAYPYLLLRLGAVAPRELRQLAERRAA